MSNLRLCVRDSGCRAAAALSVLALLAVATRLPAKHCFAQAGTSANANSHQADTPQPGDKTATASDSASKGPAEPPRADQPAKETEAERFARLRRNVEQTQQQLEEARGKQDAAQAEYDKTDAEHETLAKDLEAKSAELEKLKISGTPEEVTRLEAEIADLTERKRFSKDRRDLAFKEQQTLREQIPTLEKKIEQDRAALAALGGPTTEPKPASPPSGDNTAALPGPPGQVRDVGSGTAPAGSPAAPIPGSATPPTPSAETPPAPAAGPAAGLMPGVPGPVPATPGTAASPKPISEELKKATKELETQRAKAQEAAEQVKSKDEQIESLRQVIKLDVDLLATAQKKAHNAQEAARTMDEQARNRWAEGAERSEVNKLWAEVEEARKRHAEAQKEVEDLIARIDKRQAELDQLQTERIAVLKLQEQQRQAEERAQKKVEDLQHPLSLKNLRDWALVRGPRAAVIIVGVFVLLRLAGLANRRITKHIADRGERGTMVERENRARTLVQVFHNAASVVVVGGGVFMLLSELGINLQPIVGTAAVIGLAVAFGAQNLVRDYFSGFMILVENQFGVNDVVRLGEVSGLVERITLRVTVLRDLEGVVHFVPNGEITRVSNMTHGWSRAMFDIGVSYKEDVDRVMELLVQIGSELRAEPEFKMLILDAPEMLGVDAFGDSAVVIKFLIKTRPLQQWKIKREMLRRIKMRFDEQGIEIPYPHRTVYHRYEEENGSAEHHRQNSAQPWEATTP